MKEVVPEISVVMAVFNNEADLAESIDSILAQTFEDFEFIIIDDGSVDTSPEILARYAEKDARIHILTNERNMKLAASLNRGIAVSKGRYIARMDADDVALENRFSEQYDYMQANQGVAVCGGWVEIYEFPNIVWKTSTSEERANCATFFESCFHHPTVFIRKSVVEEYGSYDESVEFAQDCHLWSRLAFDHGQKLINLPKTLLRYRTHPEKQRDEYRLKQYDRATTLRQKNLSRLGLDIGVNYNQEDYAWHDVLCRGEALKNQHSFKQLREWIRRLEVTNSEKKILSVIDFKHELEQKLLRVCLASAPSTLSSTFFYLQYCGSHDILKNMYRSLRMLLKYFSKPSKVRTE